MILFKGMVKLTVIQYLKHHFFWIPLFLGIFLSFLFFVMGDVSLTYKTQMLDATSYFLADVVLFFTAIHIGSESMAQDFSTRGLAELCIPMGLGRTGIIVSRFLGTAIVLFLLALSLLLCRFISFIPMEQWPERFMVSSLWMFSFSYVKALLANSISRFLNTYIRSVLAILSTLFLFIFGHFSTHFDGFKALSSVPGETMLDNENIWFKLFQFWNPNYLVLGYENGGWDIPQWGEGLLRISWGLSGLILVILFHALVSSNRDIVVRGGQ